MEFAETDFLDLGAKDGGSIRFGVNAFGGTGVGVDKRPGSKPKLEALGYKGITADASQLPMPDNAVRFVQALHFLEHLPNAEIGERVIASSIAAARDFFMALGPDFSDVDYLAQYGFKKYFATWRNHPWRHTAQELRSILAKYPQYRWKLIQFNRIRDSNSSVLWPLDAPGHCKRFDPTVSPPKIPVVFDRAVFEHIAFVVVKSDRFSADEILMRAMQPRQFAEHGNVPLYKRPNG
jgi:hypothetical protein